MKSRKNRDADAAEDRKRNDALNKSENRRDGDLPGDYPAKEDIMNRMNTERDSMDVENFSRAAGSSSLSGGQRTTSRSQYVPPDTNQPGEDIEDKHDNGPMEHPVPKNMNYNEDEDQQADPSEVTGEDIEALGPKDLSMDMGEDEQLLKNRVWPVDMAAEDLDIPGPEDAGAVRDEGIGPEDEENDFYSLGGDRHEDDMEGK